MMSNTQSFEIKQLTNDNLPTFTALIDLFNKVFEAENPSMASKANSLKLLNNKHFIAIVTLAENEVVGGLTAYELPMYSSDRSEIFLYDLAVKPEYQRQGIGKGLIQSLKEYCAKHGIKEFFVMAHEEDEHAIEFYHATGGNAEKVINFLYKANEE